MVSIRRLEKRAAAAEKVKLLFYEVLEKNGKKMMKPLRNLETEIPMAMARAISENTIKPEFYDRLVADLRQRGVAEGTILQLRVQFSKAMIASNPHLKGLVVLCELKV